MPFPMDWSWSGSEDQLDFSGTAHFKVPQGDTVHIRMDHHRDYSFLRAQVEEAYREGKRDGLTEAKRRMNHTLNEIP